LKNKTIAILDKIIYWLIILLPFSIAISMAPMNVFMGLLLGLFLIKKILKKENPFIKTEINTPLLFLFIITCISSINSIDLQDTLKGGVFKLLRYIFIFFIMMQEVKDAKHVRKIVGSMIFGMVLVSFDGIWQVLTGKDFIRGYETIVNIGLKRATASFKDANVFGIFLNAFAPLIFGLALYYSKIKKKIIALGICFIILVATTLTYSRPTLLAVYIALFFLGIVRRNKILISVLIGLIFISPFLLPKSFKEWAKEVEYNPLRVMCNDDRIAIFRNSINMIKDHPIIGVGANTFMKNYKYYKESPEYRDIVTSDYIYAHNNFLHIAGELGMIGLVIFLWLLYKMVKAYKSIYAKLDQRYIKIIFLSLTACLISFQINGLTESSLYYSRVSVMFWYLAGFAFAFRKFTLQNKPR